jgi:uncharacterized protein YidB (DUF937 family)
MSNGFPSMTALLGLLAVAGYQNRDKLAEMLSGAQGGAPGGGMSGGMARQGGGMGSPQGGGMMGGGMGRPSSVPQTGGGMGGLSDLLGGAAGGGLGGLLGGGIGEVVDRFRQNGHGEVADSWVAPGPNREIAPQQLEGAIGPDVLAELQRRTGLPREELLARLSRDLPRAIDDHTPQGRIPTRDDFDRF